MKPMPQRSTRKWARHCLKLCWKTKPIGGMPKDLASSGLDLPSFSHWNFGIVGIWKPGRVHSKGNSSHVIKPPVWHLMPADVYFKEGHCSALPVASRLWCQESDQENAHRCSQRLHPGETKADSYWMSNVAFHANQLGKVIDRKTT